MRSVNFAWSKGNLIVEEHRESSLKINRYGVEELLARIGSIIGDAKHEFVDFLNATIPDKDIACLLINGRKAVVYGVANIGISITVRDGGIVVHSKDMAGQVACIIRREAKKNIVVIV